VLQAMHWFFILVACMLVNGTGVPIIDQLEAFKGHGKDAS
jgi:hypothetical protein